MQRKTEERGFASSDCEQEADGHEQTTDGGKRQVAEASFTARI